MGADGHLMIVDVLDIPSEYTTDEIEYIGWTRNPGILGGRSFFFRYWDTERFEPLPWVLEDISTILWYERSPAIRANLNNVNSYKNSLEYIEKQGGREKMERLFELHKFLVANSQDLEVWT